MSFLIDTDICSAYLRGNPIVFNRFLQYSGQLSLSAVSLAELYSWTKRASGSAKRADGLRDMLSATPTLPVDDAVAERCGEIRALLLDQGRPIGIADLLIAATALVHGVTLVTGNTQDFSAVPGISLANWLTP